MKKVMVAAAIICAVAFARAAAVDWTIGGVVDPVASAAAGKNVAANGFAAYMILSSSLQDVTIALANGSTVELTSAAVGPTKNLNNKGAAVAGTASGNVASGNQDFYAIVLNAASADKATAFYVSQKVTMAVDASMDTLVGFGSQVTASKAAANWTSMSVPEPTSGLLLLLGMAGLALKRKRA